jgi:glycerophosphoryl diester phosphodiesterase
MWSIPDGLPQPPWLVAHRGASADEPENTLASIATALEQGADMIEIDLHLTADGELLATHDAEMTIGGRQWPVEDSEASTIRRAAAGPERTDRAALPTIAEILALIPDTVPINIELKRAKAEIDSLVAATVESLGERSRVIVSSFDWDLLASLRRSQPDALIAPIGSRRPLDLLRAATRLGAATVHCHRRVAFGDFVSAARAEGWPVLVYTINEAAQARQLFDRGVAGIFTDMPGAMRDALRSS